MTSIVKRYEAELEQLISTSDEMVFDLHLSRREEEGELTQKENKLKKEFGGSFQSKYQRWYTEAYSVISQLIPNRLDEFVELYRGDPKRKKVDALSFTIKDWLMGARTSPHPNTGEMPFDDRASVAMRFRQQIEILKAGRARFESSLLEIRQLLQADLFDSGLEASSELLRNGYLRAAGIVAGVVLEGHLQQVCTDHGLKIRKKRPTIADFNDLLKENNVIDIPQWRFIQRLADLRNLCGHKKTREPSQNDVSELIAGVEKIIKTLS